MQGYGNLAVVELVSRTKERTGTDIMNNKVSQIQRTCYRDFTTNVKKERAKDRYEDAFPIK